MKALLVLLLFALGVPGQASPEVYLSTQQGVLRGLVHSLEDGSSLHEYRGIPYAKPPLGALRFQPPEPAEGWPGVRDAQSYGDRCAQGAGNDLINNTGTSEDCLFLNVFSPQPHPRPAALLPVMVWVHGGGFFAGSGSDYNATGLAARGRVLVVTLNYRLDAFGFLSTGDDTIPGNMGLLDSVMALRWVRDNIRDFGGDPGQVTIFGQSAGSFAVSLLCLSPLSRGLFHRAIKQSGSVLAPGIMERKGIPLNQRDYLHLLASQLGCPGCSETQNSCRNFLACLNARTTDQVVSASLAVREDLLKSRGISYLPLTRVGDAFLPELPEVMLAKGMHAEVDTMQGFTKDELATLVEDPDDDGVTVKEFKDMLALFLGPSVNGTKLDSIINATVDKILKNECDPFERRAKLVSTLDKYFFEVPCLKEMNYVAGNMEDQMKRHFFYRDAYRLSYLNYRPDWNGVGHFDDVGLVFALPEDTLKSLMRNNTFSTTDRAVSNHVVDMWVNFAKYGHPTPRAVDGARWKESYTPGCQPPYLDIETKLRTGQYDTKSNGVDEVFQLINAKLFHFP